MSEHRLSEILIERPRSGMRISYRKMTGTKKQLSKLTQEAAEDGLLRPYLIKPRYKSKSLSDHLGPLRRFLRSHVGQPWNDVYSKICQQLDTSTMAGQHVISHLWDYVELNVEMIEGVPYSKNHYGYYGSLINRYGDRFYVHPETGVFCLARDCCPLREAESQQDLVMISEDKRYQKLNEIWYLISFADFPPPPTYYVRDVLCGVISRNQAMDKGGRKIYAAGKRQCGKKEIRFILSQLAKE